MQSTWLTRGQFGLCLSALFCLATTSSVWGWQFRDLGDPQANEAVEPEPADLVPTSETFQSSEPIGDEETQPSEDTQPAEPKVEPKVETKVEPKVEPKASESTVKSEAKVPTAAETPKPDLEPVSVIPGDPGIEPVPMQPEAMDSETGDMRSAFGEPAPANAPDPRLDVRAARFNNAQPGTTTAEELIAAWGEPAKTLDDDAVTDGKTLIYKVPSFKQVDVAISGDVVSSILVHLEQPLAVAHVAKELDLMGFTPVPIPDEFGDVLGQAYPERGLLFGLDDDLESLRVAQILLEPVSAETFRLRAQHDFDHQYKKNLLDLAEAIRLDPQDAEAHWLIAEILDAVGRADDAILSAEKAVDIAPAHAMFRLTRARLLAKTGNRQAAIEETQALLDEVDMPHEVAARANCQLGDLMAVGAEADHQEALKYHLKAIDLAMKVVGERRFAIRRMAKRVLIDTHLSVARDIALGNFQRQREVVPKWLLRATELADEYITNDHGDELLRMHILRTTLAAYAELKENFDAAVVSAEAMKDGKQMIAAAPDTLYKSQIERLLGETLFHSAKIERANGRYDDAMRYANNAVALLGNNSETWQRTEHDRYLQGQLYFLIGSIYAVQQEDHAESIAWYQKAAPLIESADIVSPLCNPRDHGETYVSMGVSYWTVGNHAKAVRLTEQGAELMKQAVEQGTLKMAALAIPYGNLAAMHDKMGHSDRSKEFAMLASKLEKTDSETTRR